MASNSDQVEIACSFCGMPQSKVVRLIAGPGVYICEGCVALCAQILSETGGSLPPVIEVERRKVRDRWVVSQHQVVRPADDSGA